MQNDSNPPQSASPLLKKSYTVYAEVHLKSGQVFSDVKVVAGDTFGTIAEYVTFNDVSGNRVVYDMNEVKKIYLIVKFDGENN